MKIKLGVAISVLSMMTAFADAPVVDLNDDNSGNNASTTGNVPTVNLSPEQRIARLEQQMNNFSQANSASRIDQLQQQVNQLQGQLDQQTHQLQQLQDQQKTFYQDIDQRLTQLKATPANTTPAPAASSAPASADEQALYQKAFAALGDKKYPQAVSGLQQYLKQFPQGKYAANAHYWLGEVYSLQNKPQQAEQEFQVIVSQYPKDQKYPDALLKIAFIHDNAGKHAQAKQELQKIIKQFPGTPAAQLASLRLKSLHSQ
jgi:tol-pal system protein YbgF